MSDSPRQEIKFTFGGRAFSVRPTFAVLSAIEASLAQPSRQLGVKVLRLEVSIMEMAAIMAGLLSEQPNPPDAKACGEIITEDGYDDLIAPVGDFLTRALKGNKHHEREAAREAAEAAARKDGEAAGSGSAGPQKTEG